MKLKQVVGIGTLRVRWRWRGVASWGYPALELGGLSFFTRHSDGALGVVAYHPRWSTTWIWSVVLSARQAGMWTREARARRRELYASGNPHASRPRWWHRFVSRDALRRNQWHDYFRLPLGWSLIIGRQNYHLDRRERSR